LIRSQHPPHVQVGGGQQLEIYSLDRAAPAVILAGPYALVMPQQPVAAGIAVIFERNDAVGYVDMITQEALGRNDSLRIKAGKRRLIQENARKDMAGAVPKEHSVRQ
jgi:hypothetical protein